MTETEQWVNQSCERLMASGHVFLYRDLYKDLRERLSCGVACRLIAQGLVRTRGLITRPSWAGRCHVYVDRARAIAALKRLERYSDARDMALLEELNAALVWGW